MVLMTEEGQVKKERDPIFMVCLVVFLVALVAVCAASVYADNFKEDTTTANSGATVTVDYVGTFYDYYGEEHAVIFDTNIWSIVDGESSVFSNDYVTKTESSCTPLSFVVGGTTVLADFGNAVLGHKVGDKIKVIVTPENGYVSADTVMLSETDGYTVDYIDEMTYDQFYEAYGYYPTGLTEIEKSVYGWPASVSYDSSSEIVTLMYLPEINKKYTVESEFGELTFTATDIASSIEYTVAVSDYKLTGNTVSVEIDGKVVVQNEIEMIMIDLGGDKVYITGVNATSGEASSFIYKTVEERYNQTLYFTITVKSIANVTDTISS